MSYIDRYFNYLLEDEKRDADWVHRAEVIVFKDGNLMVGKRTKNEQTWYTLPGGKAEKNESMADAAYRETLEEVGVRIKNIKEIGTQYITWKNNEKGYPDANKKHKGIMNHFFTAEMNTIDDSKHNRMSDKHELMFMDPKEYIKHLKTKLKNPRVPRYTHPWIKKEIQLILSSLS